MLRRWWQGVAARIVGLVRRRPVTALVLWFAASWLPVWAADLVQFGGAVVVAFAWLTAGSRKHTQQVDSVAAHWAKINGTPHRVGWFGLGNIRVPKGGV